MPAELVCVVARVESAAKGGIVSLRGKQMESAGRARGSGGWKNRVATLARRGYVHQASTFGSDYAAERRLLTNAPPTYPRHFCRQKQNAKLSLSLRLIAPEKCIDRRAGRRCFTAKSPFVFLGCTLETTVIRIWNNQLRSLFNCLGIFTAALESWRERTRVLHFVATRRTRYSAHTLA